MALGPNDLKQIVLPTNWDATTLQRLALRDGTTYATLIGDINAGLGVLNGANRAGYLAGMFSETDNPTTEYMIGGTYGFEEHTEYGKPDIKRADTRAHMIPLKKYDRMLGWTWDFLMEARQPQLDADIAAAMQDARDLWERTLLQRFFQLEADTIGTAGKSLPFADGGTTDSSYIPAPYAGQTFTSSHNHYFRTTADAAGRLASLATMAQALSEHGHMAPFDLLIPEADRASWTAVTGYIPNAQATIQYASTTATATAGDPYIGVFATDYGTVRVRTSPRIPTAFAGMFKSYGANDQRNPVLVRTDPVFFNGQVVLMATQQVQQFPLERAQLFQAFGAGIGSRENGTATRYGASGNYTTPTVA